MGDPAALAERAVDAINELHGRHSGFRAVHAKGLVCGGTFTATPEAASLSRAAHLQGQTVPVVARFSNGSGNPLTDDRERDGRGLAVKFALPDGSKTDTVSVSLPCFFVREPEDFVSFTRAAVRGPAALVRLPLFLIRHPEALRALRFAAGMKPPLSYATCRYFGIHTFIWLGPDGTRRAVRYRWEPELGVIDLPRDQETHGTAGYLQEEIAARLEREPVRFSLLVTIAEDGDRLDDPTKVWPDDRRTITAGTLELTGLDASRERDGDILVFDPTRVTDGIELSGDRVLRFRTHAYSESVERRSGVSRPPHLDGA